MEEVKIRLYNKLDKEQCLLAFKSNVPKFFTIEEIEDFDSFLDMLDAVEEDKNSIIKTSYFVVELNNNIIGCGGLGDKDNKQIVSLAWGLIHNEFHKMGFGEKLLTYRLAFIKEQFPLFPVVIDTTQYSYKFFEKYGFKTTQITNDYYTVGMHRYDMVLEN